MSRRYSNYNTNSYKRNKKKNKNKATTTYFVPPAKHTETTKPTTHRHYGTGFDLSYGYSYSAYWDEAKPSEIYQIAENVFGARYWCRWPRPAETD